MGTDWPEISRQLRAILGEAFAWSAPQVVGGGCINAAYRMGEGSGALFLKLNARDRLGTFEAEAAGLEALAATRAIRVPRPICTGVSGGQAFIAMEYIPLLASPRNGEALAGQQLAALHRSTQPRFGWERDNTIGATPQSNRWHDDWIEFWRDERLTPQLCLAARNGHGGQLQHQGERLLGELPALIDHRPQASLLHGDLWGGNLAYDAMGQPVVYDPAVYFGDREADLAMTELFGGFGRDFYAAYRAAWPLDAGYGVRKHLYNLYHILNHLNLFGTGYLRQSLGMMDRLLAEVGRS